MLRMVEIKKDDTRNLLADIQLFEGLTPSQLDWVAQRAHRRVFSAGTNVLTIEQPGEAVYIDSAGALHTSQCSENAKLTPCIFEHVYFF